VLEVLQRPGSRDSPGQVAALEAVHQ
jgi:hypothetical protein